MTMGNHTLETELERRAVNDKTAKEFFHKYENMKIYLTNEYYRWTQANCKFYTDHGEQHVQSVSTSASLLLSDQINDERALIPLDIFLILSAIIWHDVGVVYGRSNHASRIADMTEEIKKLGFSNPVVHRLVTEISKAHSGNNGLNIPKRSDECTINNFPCKVYPRALASIVRFADEISENHSRISLSLLPDVPDKNRIFWEYANCIVASNPEPERERVVITIEIQKEKVLQEFICSEFNDRVNSKGQISLIEYIICRLEKMNNERVYCLKESTRYTSIREIEARITILDGIERINNYDTIRIVLGDSGLLKQESYPEIDIFDGFFESYPILKPERIKDALFL